MDKNLRLLVLDDGPSKDRRLGSRINRSKALNAISKAGAKVRHDSGGRLLLVEMPESAQKTLTESVPGARLMPVDSDVRKAVADLDPTEALFLDALKIRTSKSYRDAKARRKYGDTPEEKELLKAPDHREEY